VTTLQALSCPASFFVAAFFFTFKLL
jgi:hypothetical protein